MSLFRIGTATLLFCLLLGVGRTPAVSAAGDQSSDVEEIEKSLRWQQGEIIIGDNLVRLNVPPTFHFLGHKDANTVLTSVWGNPATKANILGMIFPAGFEPTDPRSWGVVITYEADGYVRDDEAATINYGDLLKQLQKAVEDQNGQRTQAGYPAVHLVSWAAPPQYDRNSHKLYWAKELSFESAPENTLNYNIRVLGRRGVLVLNAVAAMARFPEIQRQIPQVLAMVDFAPGSRYTDFQPGSDRVAEYGLIALIAGGVAAKAGLFKGLLAVLLAGKKLIIVGIAALGVFLGRTFRRRKPAAGASSGENATTAKPLLEVSARCAQGSLAGTMEVHLKSLGCVGQLGAVLSLGLIPLWLRFLQAKYPATLGGDAMILRNGKKIPWHCFTRSKATDAYVMSVYINTTYEFWHTGGRVGFVSNHVQDADAIVEFILRHLPSQAVNLDSWGQRLSFLP